MLTKIKIFDWQLLLGCITGIIFLYIALLSEKESLDFEELALGTENVVTLGQVDGLAIHCHDLNDFDNCLSSYKRGGDGRPVLLWLGMRENTYLITAAILLCIIATYVVRQIILPRISFSLVSFKIADVISVGVMVAFVIIFLRPINQFIYFQF
tara:strand:+ start:52 stop:513 length:462 start_codon:yes stop_codon:yes gene_type:complete